ncbi:MAG: Rrf2 family nitric oxide-sensitive transcriptional repressor [Polyangiales bacterium]|jgi:Rrf2 family nitric oxide-sensitive transcriptional repressor
MRLQQRTDYALRALMYLADSVGATPSEIAQVHGISPSHMAKVMQTLSGAGFVDAKRGRGKLTTLARPAESISVAEVIRCFEAFDLAECFRDDGQCLLNGNCNLERALQLARDAFLESLAEITLASLVTQQTKKLLSLAPRKAKL